MFHASFTVRALAASLLLFASFYSYSTSLEKLVIVQQANSNKWQVSYQFSEPTGSMLFPQSLAPFIESSWLVSNARITAEAEHTGIVLNKKNKTFALEVSKPFNSKLLREYTPFVLFENDSVSLFVDHYIPTNIETSKNFVLSIRSANSAHLWYDGQIHTQSLQLGSKTGKRYGYVTFSDIPPVKTENYYLHLDSELPSWVAQIANKKLPLIFEFFERELGPLSSAYLSFAFANVQSTGRPHLDGGYMNNEILLNIAGKGWQEYNKHNDYAITMMVAHELAHAWQYQYQGVDYPIWLKEGGADVLANLALLKLGFIDKTFYINKVDEAYSQCFSALKFSAITEFGNSTASYHCGESIFIALSAIDDSFSPLRVWQKLVKKQALPWSTELFLDSFNTADNAPQLAVDLNNILFAKSRETRIDSFAELMSVLSFSSLRDKQTLKNEIVYFVLRDLCGDKVQGFWFKDGEFSADLSSKCDNMSEEFSFAYINDINVISSPVKAYETLKKACNSQSNYELRSTKLEKYILRCSLSIKEINAVRIGDVKL